MLLQVKLKSGTEMGMLVNAYFVERDFNPSPKLRFIKNIEDLLIIEISQSLPLNA